MFEEDFPADLLKPIGVFPGKPGGGQSDRSTGESDVSSNLSVSVVPSWGSGPGRPLLGRPYIPPLELPLHMQGRPFGTSYAGAGSSKDQEPHASGGPAPTGWPRTEFPTFAPQTLTAANTQTQSKTAVVFGPAQEQGGSLPPPFPWGTGASGSGGYASRHFLGGDGNDDGDGGDGGRKPEDKKKKKKKKSKKGKGGAQAAMEALIRAPRRRSNPKSLVTGTARGAERGNQSSSPRSPALLAYRLGNKRWRMPSLHAPSSRRKQSTTGCKGVKVS